MHRQSRLPASRAVLILPWTLAPGHRTSGETGLHACTASPAHRKRLRGCEGGSATDAAKVGAPLA